MPLTKLQFIPGVNRETTGYANEGGWWDIDKVRFRMGYPEKIGGWEKFSPAYFLGTCRFINPWVALDSNEFVGFGTTSKFYVFGSGAYNDITPIRSVTAAGDVTFSATNGSSTITVSDSSHEAFEGDFVTFSGAVSLGGNITAGVLNQEYVIDTVVNANSYRITARTAGTTIPSITTTTGLNPTPVLANASDVGSGGASTVGTYQINSGLNTSILGTGWSAGTWSRGTWGSGATVTVPGAALRLWGGDNYGENLIFNVRDGGIYYWDKDTTYPRAVVLSSLPGATYAPQIAKQTMVSDTDRHVIAFGCDDEFTPGVQDPLLIRFSSQEDLTDWQSLPTNTAGSLRIGTGSEIVCAIETKQQMLVFTDVSVHAMQYLGPPFTFGVTVISDNTSIAGPNAAISVDDAVFWMGQGTFFVYDGVVSLLPCTVLDYVFSNINDAQTDKIICGANQNFGEIWWFYPSLNSQENDRYVVYNYQQKLWYFGALARTAWTHKNVGIYPLATSLDHVAYLHEVGFDDGSTYPASAITAYIESSGQDIGDGDQFSFITRIIPDMTFRDSPSSPSAVLTIKMANFPGANFSTNQTNNRTVIRTATYPVEQYTEQLYVRARGRSFVFRVESSEIGVGWRFGLPRLDIRTDGRR
jgi:hypothetical protein